MQPNRDDLGHLQERPEHRGPAGAGGEATRAELPGGVVAADGGQRTRQRGAPRHAITARRGEKRTAAFQTHCFSLF